jgi:hypothetical protein
MRYETLPPTLRDLVNFPCIRCMIEEVTHERFYKDVAHEPLRPTVPKDPMTHRTSSPPAIAPSCSTHSGGASSSSS